MTDYSSSQAVATTMKVVQNAVGHMMNGVDPDEAFAAEWHAMVQHGAKPHAAMVVVQAASQVAAVMAADAMTGRDTDTRAAVASAYAEVMAA